MAPKSKQGKKAQPGEGKSQPNRVTVHLPEMLVEALQRVYKTEDVQRAMLQSAENSLPKSRWRRALSTLCIRFVTHGVSRTSARATRVVYRGAAST